MCQYKKLALSKNGYILECNNCCDFQIAFGTTFIQLNPIDFIDFAKKILKSQSEIKKQLGKNQKTILINIPNCSVKYIFSICEIIDFIKLLKEALFTIDKERILKINNWN